MRMYVHIESYSFPPLGENLLGLYCLSHLEKNKKRENLLGGRKGKNREKGQGREDQKEERGETEVRMHEYIE